MENPKNEKCTIKKTNTWVNLGKMRDKHEVEDRGAQVF